MSVGAQNCKLGMNLCMRWTHRTGPTAQPICHPVIPNVLPAELTVIVRFHMSGSLLKNHMSTAHSTASVSTEVSFQSRVFDWRGNPPERNELTDGLGTMFWLIATLVRSDPLILIEVELILTRGRPQILAISTSAEQSIPSGQGT